MSTPSGNEPHGRGRRKQVALSRDLIVDFAQRIVERDGVDALTMRRLAGEVGCSPMGLYRHVSGRDELLMLLLDRLAADLPRPRLSRDPRRRLIVLAGVLYDGLARSPWVVQVLVKGDLMAPSVLWLIEAIIDAFVDAGLTVEEAGEAYLTLWLLTVGELVVSRSTGETAAALDREPHQMRLLAGVDVRKLPRLAELADFWPRAREHGDYRKRLRATLDGLLPHE